MGWTWVWALGGLVAIWLTVAWAGRRAVMPSGRQRTSDALNVLDARFARGEIDADEYRQARRAIVSEESVTRNSSKGSI